MQDLVLNKMLTKYECVETMDKIISLSENNFDDIDREIFMHVKTCYVENKDINEVVNIDDRLKDRIMNIISEVIPSAKSIDFIIETLNEKQLKKQIEFNLRKRITEIKDSNIDDIINNTISDMIKCSKDINDTSQEKYIFNSVDMKINFYEKYEKNKKKAAIKTNIKEIDNMLKFHSKEVYTIAARPGSGKTALSLSFLKNFCKTGNNGLFFSLEMGEEQLTNRIISSISGVDLDDIDTGSFMEDKESNNKVATALERLEDMNFKIIDKSALRIEDIISITKKLNKEQQINFIIVDHVGLIKPSNREEKRIMIDNAYKEFKYIAKELDIPVIVLAQLNRNIEQRADPTPKLSDLKDSGSIEEDSAAVIMLNNPSSYKKKEDLTPADKFIEIFVRKNRFGSLGEEKVFFDGSTQYIGGIVK